MLLMISLAVAVLFSLSLRKPLKKHPWPFYLAAIALSAVLAVVELPNAPAPLSRYVLDLFRRGTLGTALFIVVMYIGTFKNGSKAMKTLMPIRGELSILASILCLCHNVFFGRTYFVAMFTHPAKLPTHQLVAGLLSVILLCIMIPLFIMSFPRVRKKMNPRKWKKIQRTAYGYYGLLYVHIMILMFPFAMRGMADYAVSITVYTLIYAPYVILRLKKAKFPKRVKLPIQIVAAVAAVCILSVNWVGYAQAARQTDTPEEETGVLHDGVYTGSGTGYVDKIQVSITVKDGKIVEIALGDHHEDGPYITQATALFDSVIEQQTYDVDVVSGATLSSRGLKTAIKRAMAASMKGASGETADASATSGEKEAVRYADGTYTGTGAGYGGKMAVEVDIVDGKIAAIRLLDNKETEPYITDAKAIIDTMLEQQTYDVDAVSGATMSSDGIITAVRRALKQAKVE